MDTQTATLTNQGVSSIKYCLYARKSSELDELQALSVDSQVKEMLEMASKEGMIISEVRKESHSAKDSGQRPVFNQLLQDIGQGVFNGILCWAPDRLSRNAGDLGRMVDLMDQGKLVEIRTHGQKFTNSPNEKFLLMILGSQAKLENDHKGVNVKRGLRAKCDKGYRPGCPPLGYIHDKYSDKGDKKVFTDPKRAPYIKEMFKKVAYEKWSGRKIYSWLNYETDFRTKNNKMITLSMIYRILDDTYYYGEFEYPKGSDKWYQGKHDPIISKDLFLKTREQLKRDNFVRRSEAKEFAFTRLLTCGLCGSGISADEKFKKLNDGTVARYVYYGCTRARDRFCKCKYIREDELINQLTKIIDRIDLNELDIKSKFDEEIDRYNRFTKRVLKVDNKELAKEREVDLRKYAQYILRDGTVLEKRELLSCLTSKLSLKDRKLYLKK